MEQGLEKEVLNILQDSDLEGARKLMLSKTEHGLWLNKVMDEMVAVPFNNGISANGVLIILKLLLLESIHNLEEK
jgi:hypothetical protein